MAILVTYNTLVKLKKKKTYLLLPPSHVRVYIHTHSLSHTFFLCVCIYIYIYTHTHTHDCLENHVQSCI